MEDFRNVRAMKLPRIKLHVQILLGLIIGALFGTVFHVDQQLLIVTAWENGAPVDRHISNWTSLQLRAGERSFDFGPSDQLQVIHVFHQQKKKNAKVALEAKENGNVHVFEDVRELRKETTVASAIKPLGDIFIRLLMMIAIPLVFASLVVGVSSLHDVGRMARIGGKTISYYLFTTALAITIGVAFGNVIQPGKQMDANSKERLLAAYSEDAASKIEQNMSIDVVDFLVNLVPKNPVRALAEADMLQIIFFALLFGIALLMIPNEKSDKVVGFFDAVSDTMIRMVDFVMKIAPYAVFAIIAATVSEFGFGILQTLIWYMSAVLLGLIVQTFVVYPLFILLLAKGMRVRDFLRGMRPAQIVGFTTSSSAATLPVTFECCENLGAPKSITSFVLPLGATINMDGTALYQGVAAIFIAQVYGMDLSLTQQLTVILTATLASIGTAPVPGVGIIMLIIVLRSVGIPETGIALIFGVDRLLDMCRTVTNITSDATASMVVASSEGVLEPVVIHER